VEHTVARLSGGIGSQNCTHHVFLEPPRTQLTSFPPIHTHHIQPLSHFSRGNSGTYKQRVCVYDKFWKPNTAAPVFFYTGNESPVEEYINNTGMLRALRMISLHVMRRVLLQKSVCISHLSAPRPLIPRLTPLSPRPPPTFFTPVRHLDKA